MRFFPRRRRLSLRRRRLVRFLFLPRSRLPFAAIACQVALQKPAGDG
jgi:hypothetical protein